MTQKPPEHVELPCDVEAVAVGECENPDKTLRGYEICPDCEGRRSDETGVHICPTCGGEDWVLLGQHGSLSEVMRELREVKGSGWSKLANPWAALREIQGDEDE